MLTGWIVVPFCWDQIDEIAEPFGAAFGPYPTKEAAVEAGKAFELQEQKHGNWPDFLVIEFKETNYTCF